MKEGLERLCGTHALIGDVRGAGLYLGVELVRDRTTLEPAETEASRIAECMKDRAVLIGVDGPFHNVLKIKPPLVFSEDDADWLVNVLDGVLGDFSV